MTEKIFFIRHGAQIRLANHIPETKTVLDTGTYVIKADPGGVYLESLDDLVAEGKLYGDVDQRADRIIKTFLSRPNSTGVLLEGEKGSGKTLLAKRISQKLRLLKYPTLIVSSPFSGDGFNGLVQAIQQPIMMLFDEFEKVYDTEQQQALLTLFDGIFPTKKLFVVTVNDTYKVIDQLKNRPGRFFYRLHYSGLSLEFIQAYVQDNLKNKTNAKSVEVFASSFIHFNFDILKALIEEMNRYNENAGEASKFLNATPFESRFTYKAIDFSLKQAKVKSPALNSDKINHGGLVNPFKEQVFFAYSSAYTTKNNKTKRSIEDEFDFGIEEEPSRKKIHYIYFNPEHIVRINEGKFFYESPEGSLTIEKFVKPEIGMERFIS